MILSQVNKLRRIVIASVLKPVDESRMFEKIGLSLAQQGKFDVHIIGFPSQAAHKLPKDITLHPIQKNPFTRISWQRMLAPLSVLSKLFSLRPDVLIITTHELLFVGIVCQLFIGCRLFYDVQENYFRNALYTNSFPILIRQLVAFWIRCKEIITSPFINHFILAENGYQQELSFAKPAIVLQNKITKSVADQYRKKDHSGYSKILFSGTLARTTGVFEAIGILQKLHSIDSSFQLTIIGYCALHSDFIELQKLSSQHPFIRFFGETIPIPHDKILSAIHHADFGIIYYPQNQSTASSFPTKLFEYIGLQLPLVIHHNAQSHALVVQHNAGLILPSKIDFDELIHQMKSFKPASLKSYLFWESEFDQLLLLLNK